MDIPEELVEAERVVELGLLGLPGFTGISLGMREANGELFDELAVRIYVEDAANVPPGLPEEIAGVAVSSSNGTSSRVPSRRGAPMQPDGRVLIVGRCAAPAFAAVVEDPATGETLGLSCHHVVGGPGEGFIYQPKEPPQVPPISEADRIGAVVRAGVPADTAPAVLPDPGQHDQRGLLLVRCRDRPGGRPTPHSLSCRLRRRA